MDAMRKATDSLGDVDVPADKLWGAQTQRALQHFAIGIDAEGSGSSGGGGGERMPLELLRALLLLKGVAAAVNGRLGRLSPAMADAIDAAAGELLAGDPQATASHFPLSLWQSGSGTQSHMNVNEVLAELAQRRLAPAAGAGAAPRVHPNDHVNLGQSSNDMVPSAMHVAVLGAAQQRLLPALRSLADAFAVHEQAHAGLVKLGRTHLQDAVPTTVGFEAGAWRSQLLAAQAALEAALPALRELAVGGTAVGTGLNTHPDFAAGVCRELQQRTGIEWAPARDRHAALAGHEPLVALHGALKVLAVALTKIANDLRLLASGPRGGLAEWRLPANEPGSSIMPGKVNPTQCEAVVMVACQVFGNDAAVAMGAAAGYLQLNTCKPVIAANALRSLRLLADAMASFEAHTVRGMTPDAARVGHWMQQSLMLVTALTPHIGYDRSAKIAHQAHEHGCSLRDAALALGVDAADFDRWVDPRRMLGPDATHAAPD